MSALYLNNYMPFIKNCEESFGLVVVCYNHMIFSKSQINKINFMFFFVMKVDIGIDLIHFTDWPFYNWIFFADSYTKIDLAQCSKIRKKCNFKSSKTHFLQFQKLHKINFCTRKKFETTKNATFRLFSGAQIDFLPFLKMQIMLFCTFEIALFF